MTVSEFWNELIKDLLSLGTMASVIIFLIVATKKIIVKFRNETALHPYYTNEIIKKAQKNYILTKCQNLDPSDEISPSIRQAHIVKTSLINFFAKIAFSRKIPEDRFYLILGDSGMGKTTFILNLYAKLNLSFQSLFYKTTYKLIPLGEPFEAVERSINNVENKKDTILFLDGLDESPLFLTERQANSHFEKIIEFVKDFKIVLITCRTHFFLSSKDEPYELRIKKYGVNSNSFHVIKKIYISPFDELDVKKYINKKFKFYQIQKRKTAISLVDNIPDLFIRPMLLSYIEILIDDNHKYKTKYQIYETLLEGWITRESYKNCSDDKERANYQNKLHQFSYSLSNYIYEKYAEYGISVDLRIARVLAKHNKVNLNQIDVQNRSFLNRTSVGEYKFSHKSILEYLLSILSFSSIEKKGDIYSIKYNLSTFDQAALFFYELVRDPEIINKSRLPFCCMNIIFDKGPNNKREIIWVDASSFRIEENVSRNLK